MSETATRSGEVDVEKQRAETIVRSVKKAWQTATRVGGPSDDISIYLLGVAGHTEGVLLGYDLAEVAAFLGGVVDGEFDNLSDATGDISPTPEPSPGGTEWELAPLPPGMKESALIAAFVQVQDVLGWQVFGAQGGPAWGRVRFSLTVGQLSASPYPQLTLAEIRAIARLPHPPPESVLRRGYLVAEEIAR